MSIKPFLQKDNNKFPYWFNDRVFFWKKTTCYAFKQKFLECFTRKFKRNYLYVKECQTKLKCLFCRWRKTSPKHKCRFEREKNNIKMHSFKYLHMYIVHALHPSMTFLFRSESFFAYFSTFCRALQMSTDNYLQAKDNTSFKFQTSDLNLIFKFKNLI